MIFSLTFLCKQNGTGPPAEAGLMVREVSSLNIVCLRMRAAVLAHGSPVLYDLRFDLLFKGLLMI